MVPKVKERRSYLRGDFSYKVKFRVMSADECKSKIMMGNQISLRDEKKLKNGTVLVDNKETALPLNNGLIEFLVRMDEKLDQIMSMLSENEDPNRVFKQGLGVDISATGMGIITDLPVEPGQTIHANVILSRLPFVSLDVIGEIIQAVPAPEEDKTVFHVGIRFLDLGVHDKEKIIKCVFQRERASIRERKRIEKGPGE